MSMPNLVVFSHLRWRFVHQRPQHLLGRLSATWRVTFIEEPVHTEGLPFLEVIQVADELTVLVPHTPWRAQGFHDDQFGVLVPLIGDWLEENAVDQAIAWLNTPMALPLAKAMEPLCLVYDCMDELSAFQDAPHQLLKRESALMKQAVLVMADGPSLYEARRRLNANVHCIPSSVDSEHFSSTRLDHACDAAWEVQALQGHLGGPRLGFFGVIDEHLDTALVAQLADLHPEWQLVMVGPVVKIDPHALPWRANIHWLGMQPYERLPYFLAGWDVCLMPFALHDATHFISPTKALEYMAGGKPVVSTAVNDVVALYGMAVEIAYTSVSFLRACERLLEASEAEQALRRREMAAILASGSWERSASKVDVLLWEARETAIGARVTDLRGLIPRANQHVAMAMTPP